MFFSDVNEEDFIELLHALPSSPALTRAHLLGAFGVIARSDDPRGWWYALTMDRGEEGAAKAVAQLIISKGGKARVGPDKERRPRGGTSPPARMIRGLRVCSLMTPWRSSSPINMVLRSIVCEYYAETQVVLEGDPPESEEAFDPDGSYEDDGIRGGRGIRRRMKKAGSIFWTYSPASRARARNGRRSGRCGGSRARLGGFSRCRRNGMRRTWRTSCGPTGSPSTSASISPSTSSESRSA